MTDGPTGLYSIPAGRPFLRDLAEGVVARFHDTAKPLSLAAVTIFLPTRRAARTLGEALVRAAGGDALVLPAIRVLGDVDEDELAFLEADDATLAPEIGRLERELVLAGLVDAFRTRTGSVGGYAVSLALARSLARLIDEAANEDVDLTPIAGIAPPDMAVHWAQSVAFLEIAVKTWPLYLADQNRMDPAARRALAIRGYAKRLTDAWPAAPFIAAGSSGSIKATADLLKVIARLPNGAVVLDGLDHHMDGESWDKLIPSHPQFALKELLIHLGADRSQVGSWLIGGDAKAMSPRAIFLSEAMRPPETAQAWADTERRGAAQAAAGAEGLSLIEAANEREEALAVALAMREVLEQPDETVALVTADRMLARRVAAELRRWDIEADDSAGRPLAKTEAGAFLTLALAAAETGGRPVALLSLLKHPCAALGQDRREVLSLARLLERRVLRRYRVNGGFAAARAAIPEDVELEKDREALLALLDDAEAALAPLTALATGTYTLHAFVTAHAAALELLSADAKRRAGIWSGDDGAAAFALITELGEASATSSDRLTLADYAVAFDGAARGVAVRPQGARHPRVSILGPLEARMHAADLMILGGLNEGVWPSNPADDPWLNRPMRAGLGLSAPERRIGLAAHDFATLAAQPRVLLTRAKRQGGAPSNPSRFLLRMIALSGGLHRPDHAHWAAAMDAAHVVTPAERPRPAPPFTARPRSLSVTRIETLLRDPYEIYARNILQLRRLDDLEPELEARHRGELIHKAVELAAGLKAEDASGDPYTDLLACGDIAFSAVKDDPDVKAFWWPRFMRAARWLADKEAAWRQDRADFIVERNETWAISGLDFKLTGTPDRIDKLKSGGIRVIDYKTGAAPSLKQVETFLAPQLPLLAIMAREGAFGAGVQGAAEQLIYAQLSGGKTPGKMTSIGAVADVVREVERRLRELIERYDDEAQPYLSRVAPPSTRFEGDYDHLARLAEWAESAGADE